MSLPRCTKLKNKDRECSLQLHFFCHWLKIHIKFNVEETIIPNITHFFCQCKQYIGLVKETAQKALSCRTAVKYMG